MLLNFCDMDGTFIQTSRHVLGQPYQEVYLTTSGKSVVITDAQKCLYDTLNTAGIVIPVTARSLESLKRVEHILPFTSYKVCDHGVFIYDTEDQLVKAYSDSLIQIVSPHQNNLKVALDKLSRLSIQNSIFENTRFKPIYHSTYLMLIEGKAHSDYHARIIAEYLNRIDGIIVSTNGVSFTVTCNLSSYKQLACQYLVDNYFQKYVTLGFGDSLTDLPFMQSCNFSVVPNNKGTQITLGE